MWDTIYRALGWPLGWIMWLCYQLVHNYGIALLMFTLLIRVALFPLSLKQQKSTIKMQMIRPQMEELQQKYKNNKAKLNEEMMKLYQQEGYNPASGCLPLMIQMPILFGLIEVIYRPLTHILRLDSTVISIAENKVLELGMMGEVYKNLKGLNPAQLFVIEGVKERSGDFSVIAEYFPVINSLDLTFLGMNLGIRPTFGMFGDIFQGQFNPVVLIPVLSGVSALFLSILSMRNSPQVDAPGMNASMKGMMFMMPVFSTMIAFSVPAGVGLYWFYSNMASMAQTLILNKFYNPKEMAEKARVEMEERKERERLERIEAKRLAKEQGGEMQEKALSQKEINRKRLAEARKRDAEKYGEEYIEVTDDDLK